MYVYVRTSDAVWTVGFFAPAIGEEPGTFVAESDHVSADGAALRVRWLNGGGTSRRSDAAAGRLSPGVNAPGVSVVGEGVSRGSV